ncbi:hypothetical protein CMV_015978 [Castanea mollissima]|uniref:Uncharacterized protein n=1 Tax=Castanea mollissima TaxID=60419 RepID=A0A8J4VS49_9ROSI|nr:hypothetical protein CMV_015978 [Castanea mollissima]
MGYLCGSSPQLKSGTVSALSVWVNQDVDIWFSEGHFGELPLENKSKESGAGDTEITLADSFTKASVSMLEKRKHKAMGSITEENGSVEQRKRKREKKINALIPSSNERHLSYGIVGGLREV